MDSFSVAYIYRISRWQHAVRPASRAGYVSTLGKSGEKGKRDLRHGRFCRNRAVRMVLRGA